MEVIEYSAYQKLQAQNKIMREALLEQESHHSWCSGNPEYIIWDNSKCDCGLIKARQALIECDKLEDEK